MHRSKWPTTAPTFRMTNNPDSTPDRVLYTRNIKNNISSIVTHPDLGTEHDTIEIIFELHSTITENEPLKRNLKGCNINILNEKMETYLNNTNNEPITEEKITHFNTTLSQLVIESSPILKKKYYVHELPPYIIKMIKNTRKMYREYLQNPTKEGKMEINKYNNNIQLLIGQFKEHKRISICYEIN